MRPVTLSYGGKERWFGWAKPEPLMSCYGWTHRNYI